MAIIALESFDHYANYEDFIQNTDWAFPASTCFDGFGTGRMGSQSLKLRSLYETINYDRQPSYFLPSKTNSIVVGMGFRVYNHTNRTPVGFTLRRNDQDQLLVLYHPDFYRFLVQRGDGTTLGSSDFRPGPHQWYYLELSATIDSSTGSFELRVDNETVLSSTSVNTQDASDTKIDSFHFSTNSTSNGPYIEIDDLYVVDANQAGQTGFLGDVKVADLVANTDSAVTWSPNPSANPNYQNVDDGAVLDNASYNQSSTSGDQDVYGLGGLASAPRNIYAVQPVGLLRKADAGPRKIKIGLEDADNNTQQLSTNINLSTDWAYKDRVFETDADGNTWTNQTVNETKFVTEVV